MRSSRIWVGPKSNDLCSYKRRGGLPWWPIGLRLHAPNAGCLGSIPGQGTKIPYATTKTWYNKIYSFSSVQSLSRVRLFLTPWTAARQASLSITNSQSLLKLMSIKSEMPSNHLILCPPLSLGCLRVTINNWSTGLVTHFNILYTLRLDWREIDIYLVMGTGVGI